MNLLVPFAVVAAGSQLSKERMARLMDISHLVQKRVADRLGEEERPGKPLVAEHSRCTAGKQEMVPGNTVVVVVVVARDTGDRQLVDIDYLRAGSWDNRVG